MLKRLLRMVKVGRNLVFKYEVSPHRVLMAKIARDAERDSPKLSTAQESRSTLPLAQNSTTPIGDYIPFKEGRLQGKPNPLRPPIHVETVMIGKALGQETGYLFGVGYRVRDDGYVEAEFPEGVQKFKSQKDFRLALQARTKVTFD